MDSHGESLPVVTVECQGHVVTVRPPVPVLGELFATTINVPRTTRRGTVVVDTQRQSLVANSATWEDECDADMGLSYQRAPAGLYEAICVLLDRLGVEVEVTTAGRPGALAGVGQRPPGETIVDPMLIHVVASSRATHVRYGRSVIRSRLIAQLAAAWPDARVAVAVVRADDAYNLQAYLRRSLPRPAIHVLRHDGSQETSQARVVIGTPHNLWACGGIERRDILILIDPHLVATQPTGRGMIEAAVRSRIVAMAPTRQPMTVSERDWLCAYFGLEQLVIPLHGVVRRPIRVVSHHVPAAPRPARDPSGMRKSKGRVGHNGLRVDDVAELCGKVASGDHSSLHLGGRTDIRMTRHVRVGVLVSSVEHALALATRLPSWRLACGDGIDLHGLSKQSRDTYAEATAHKRRRGQGVIVTMDGLATLRSLDVLIRADACSDAVPAGWAHVTAAAVDVGPWSSYAHIIDVVDEGVPSQRRRLRLRHEAYDADGWQLVDPDVMDRLVASVVGETEQ